MSARHADFLRARLAEAVQTARAARDAGHNHISSEPTRRWLWEPGEDDVVSDHGVTLLAGPYGPINDAVGAHVMGWEPARVLELLGCIDDVLQELEQIAGRVPHPDAELRAFHAIRDLAYPWRAHPEHPDHAEWAEEERLSSDHP